MSSSRFRKLLFLLQFVVWAQRAFRFCLRAVWLAGAGYLIGWGIYSLTGWLPHSNQWFLIGGILSAIGLLGIVIRWPRRSRLVWRLDRRLDLQEQVSTAWNTEQLESTGMVGEALIADAENLLTASIKRIAFRGWFLFRELEAAAIIAILLGLVLWSGQFSSPSVDQSIYTLPRSQGILLPPAVENPTADQIYPSGIPGLKPELESAFKTSVSDQVNEGQREGEQRLSASDFEALSNALQRMGSRFSNQAATFELGQDLQQMNLEDAAQELEDMSYTVDSFTDETKRDMANIMQQTSEQIEQTTQSPLAQDLAGDLLGTAQALTQTSPMDAGEEMAKLADDMQSLANQIQEAQAADQGEGISLESEGVGSSGAGTSSVERDQGESEPFSRLQGEGEVFELEGGREPSGLLLPGTPEDENGQPFVGGAMDLLISQDPFEIESILTPIHYPWIWRDVVSAYFSP